MLFPVSSRRAAPCPMLTSRDTEYQASCLQAGVPVSALTMTLPSGPVATGNSGSGAGSTGTAGGFTFDSPTPTGTTDDPEETDTGSSGSSDSGVSDPLGGATRNNGAGSALVGASSAAVVGFVGVAVAFLAL